MKKFIRRVCVLLSVLCLTGTLPALAGGEDLTRVPELDITGMDAGEIIEAFLAEYDELVIRDKLAIGYRNMVTGEEYIINGDTEIPTASLYKLAINMYWAEKVYNGEITWDENVLGTTLKYAQEQSLILSDNTFGAALHKKVGSWKEYRQTIAPFYGVSEEEAATPHFYRSECGTVNQMLYALELLYNDPDRYPGVIECLEQATPGEFLRSVDDDRCPIAQKYGYLDVDKYGTVVNCAAIVYASQPYLLVVMTGCQQGVGYRMGILNKFLMDYADICTAEATPEVKAETEATPAPTKAPVRTAAATPTPAPEAEESSAGNGVVYIICMAVIVVGMIALAPVFTRKKKKKGAHE